MRAYSFNSLRFIALFLMTSLWGTDENIPGSPTASESIDSSVLPPAPLPFGGKINLNAAQSTAWWPPHVVPPKGAPNILLIMSDSEHQAHSEVLFRRRLWIELQTTGFATHNFTQPHCVLRHEPPSSQVEITIPPDSGLCRNNPQDSPDTIVSFRKTLLPSVKF